MNREIPKTGLEVHLAPWYSSPNQNAHAHPGDRGGVAEVMASQAGGSGPAKSLDEVHGTVPTVHRNPLKRLFSFLGPAYLVSVGYMDPGNWATDLEGGARFGYALIWVLLMSNLMAVLLQSLSARLGVVTGRDLAQACRAEYSRPVNLILWLLAEVAIAATDLAEVLGTIIALKLLFGMPMLIGCVITAFDTFLLLWLQKWGMRRMEAVILVLVATIGTCFLIQVLWAGPEWGALARGFWPSLPSDREGSSLFVAIGILGATVMPHNLYLHSALVQSRRIGKDQESRARACRYNLIDSAIALNAAFFVNAAILVLSASVFFAHGKVVTSIEQASDLLLGLLGPAAPILFGVALLCAGQSSTLTGTLAGQIVMEGYLDLRIAPWLRRLITRMLALAPAVAVIYFAGESRTTDLIILSQVILSLQLSFAVVPLIHFTSNKKNMGAFASRWWAQILAWTTATIIVGLNGYLVVDTILKWVSAASESGKRVGPVPLSWVIGVPLFALLAGVVGLLAWVTIKPWVWPSEPWTEEAPVTLDWADALRPRPLETIAVALEHSPGDTEILNRALSLAVPHKTRLMLLHVVDTPMSSVYGVEAGDRHAGADAVYLDGVADALRRLGFLADPIMLYGADRAGEIVGRLRKEPVDLLVVGSHGHGLVRDMLYGQTVDKVRHGLDIPMLIARPERT